MASISQQMRDNDNRNLVFKPVRSVGFIGTDETEVPDSLFEDGELKDFKAEGWLPVGLVTPDGFTFSREVEREALNAFGYTSPIMNPITAVPRTIAFTPYETVRKHLLEITLGADLGAATMDPQTGEVVIQEPEMPIDFEFPFLVLGEGGPADNNMIQGKGYYSVQLQTTAEEIWGSEGANAQQLTLDVFTGDESGVPVQHYFAGTALLANHEAAGFEQATAGS
jgi:hypothetical protein